MPKSVLFICLGNICRSPIAEAVFRQYVNEKELQNEWLIDGAAIGAWHIGKPPYKDTIKVLAENGITTDHKARQITKGDFTKFDVIFGMDEENMEDLKERAPKNSTASLELLGSYDPEGELIIEDPYYGTSYKDFQKVFEQCQRCCKEFLKKNS